MDINQINCLVREVINKENAAQWFSSNDHRAFSQSLIGPLNEHDIVASILVDVIDELLQRKAEDMFADYRVGEGVTILEKGHSIPATVINHEDKYKVVVQLDKIAADGHFERDQQGEQINFHCSHDSVYVHFEGRSLSRLIQGRRFIDYSPEHLEHELERLDTKSATAI
ncbi:MULTISPECIES: hypothetical protein [unclassified Neptuniibacter]|uniref:hypothetical protein n=1 Tax=unclassified Neptuniibacter TaxID=2630693 RepID=UPI000C37895D|nr:MULTISPECIES: hypothetical protein [unclassified Neptuniibacter]MAY41586.1 hypothetical protein [Oceanospirillaceae bacterium]|tara:strand:- start:23572 stop:24078 length:507 start_codon:yes stop_codon:yes gene_type:complete